MYCTIKVDEEVPESLVTSTNYENMIVEGDNEDTYKMKKEDLHSSWMDENGTFTGFEFQIETVEDLVSYFDVFKKFGIKILPIEFLQFVRENKETNNWNKIINDFHKKLERDMEEYDIEFIEKIQIYATNSPERAMVKIASKGWINLMRYLYAEWEEKYYEAEENGTEIDSIWSLAVADQAAWYGCYECLKFAIDKGCPTDPSVSTSAAWHGHIDCLKLLFSSGCNFNQDILEKAGNASRSGGGTDNGTDDDNGNEMCFKFAFENGAFIDEGAASSWAWNSNLKMLKWLKNEMEKKGKQIILSPRAIHGAVTTRSFECVEFLVKENCPMDEWVHLAAQNALNQYNNPNVKHKETFKEWIDASKKILQFLEESGCPLHVNE